MNAAQKLYQHLGLIYFASDSSRSASYTKRGPGRRHKQGGR